MAAHEGTPLAAVPGWTEDLVRKLAANWITTAEQVVGMATTPDGVATLARELGVSEGRMRQLLEHARSALAPARASELAKEVDTRQYGLGALPPDAQPEPRRPGGKRKDHS
jgi:hypothetical protein